ncbi:hypothetical protein WICPIJ_009013 [Wickerhamomyces pijperi]|uniref:SAM domain-containing protein n=1 Tax=Wickerhamomyces pijperi TaxID=599730 RepID=A0A9P8PS46_WICPI|nr:hypothetical protein WICPIJ_009013 [Wickerhamomyces pijperi]
MSSNERTASVSQLIPDYHDIDLLTADNSGSTTSSNSITTSSSNVHSQKLFTPSARSGTLPSGVLLNSVASTGNSNQTMELDSILSGPNAGGATRYDMVSPILSSTMSDNYGNVFSNAGLGIQRPLSAQDVTIPMNSNNEALRSFSAQGGPATIERPLSSMEIDSNTFKNDVGNLINWINTLNSNQLRAMIDNLLPALSDEILNYTKSKLATFQFQNMHSPMVSSPNPMYQAMPSMNEPLNLDSVLNEANIHLPHQQEQPWSPPMHNLQRTLSPGGYSSFDRTALLQEASFNRPRSADPYSKLVNQQHQQQHQHTPSKTRLSQRYDGNGSGNSNQGTFDITNLAQQLTQAQINVNDYSNPNLLKLSALSTINSRAQLDSNKKRGTTPISSTATTTMPTIISPTSTQMSHSQSQIAHGSKQYYPYDQLPLNRVNSTNTQHSTPVHTPSKSTVSLSGAGGAANNNNSTPKSPAIDSTQLTSQALLQNIPLWLKTLRLHKYTPVLGDLNWKDLIKMTDEDLKEKGVSALGARGKLLKAFEVVKNAVEKGEIS